MQLTVNPVTAAAVAAAPEWVDAKGARILFGLSRSHLYMLVGRGLIKSCCLRRPGAIRGRRLFACDSIRRYLEACVEPAPAR